MLMRVWTTHQEMCNDILIILKRHWQTVSENVKETDCWILSEAVNESAHFPPHPVVFRARQSDRLANKDDSS